MYKVTRTGESRRVKGHASFLCILKLNRTVYGLLWIIMLCAGVMCGCGQKEDAVYIAAEEDSSTAGGASADGVTAASGDADGTGETQADIASNSESLQADSNDADSVGDTGTDSNAGAVADTDGFGDAQSGSEDGLLYVYVCGAVESPGLYALDSGSRIYDAITAAGGLAADACPDYWNQAAYVSDGQMIDVPTQTEVDEGLVSQSAGSGTTGSDGGSTGSSGSVSGTAGSSGESSTGSSASGGGASNSGGSSSGTDGSSTGGTSGSGKVNINTATQEELMTLSGIGEARAAAIISYRQEHGSFSSIEDIKNVSGIGDALYDKICNDIAVD